MYKLPQLNYNYADFEPFLDADTMRIHHTKHHQAYLDNLNAFIAEQSELFAGDFSDQNLRQLVTRNQLAGENPKLVNNGGGHLNHAFFWQTLRPPVEGENLPEAELVAKIEADFGSFANFQTEFKAAGLGRFGSGWVWLVFDGQKLKIEATPYQNLPQTGAPILGLDVWEHAYYLKYQNLRADYIDAFWQAIDWQIVAEFFSKELQKFETEQAQAVNACGEMLFALDGDDQILTTKAGAKRVLYTDGSASPNPGPGGFAIIENGQPIALGAENPSTNIRMEGLALKKALEILGETEAEILTDSEFWINLLTKWAPTWQKNGWTKKTGEIKNLDIVKPLFELYQNSNATLTWLKGHAGHEHNELADEWANRARAGEKL